MEQVELLIAYAVAHAIVFIYVPLATIACLALALRDHINNERQERSDP